MALVSTKYNFIFIHIYRTGGNAVRKALGAPAVHNPRDLLGGTEVLGVHVDAADLQQYYTNSGESEFFDNAFKFVFVRNPFSWLVSTYKYIKYSPGHNFHSLIKDKSYYYFLEWYVDVAVEMNRPFGSNKYSRLLDFVYDHNGNLIVDYIGKTENMNADLVHITKKLGLQLQQVSRVNKSNNKRNWKSYYNEKRCIEFVEYHFANDLTIFGYDWRTS